MSLIKYTLAALFALCHGLREHTCFIAMSVHDDLELSDL
jgi:hypothetical protein